MNNLEATCFIIPIGFGSAILFYLSMFVGDTISPFTDNKTYEMEISILLLISFLYFVMDFVLMIIRYNPRNNIYFVHHSLGIFAIMIVYFKYYYFIKYLMGYLTYELSTPFLNFSLSYHRSGISNILSKISSLCFFISFTFVRILFGTYLSVKVISYIYSLNNQSINYLILLPIGLQCLNYWWYSKIIAMMRKSK